MSLALVDESLPLPEGNDDTGESAQAIQANIFAKNIEHLPDICYAGDIVRLRRVKVQEWKGEIQLLGLRKSSYVVLRGDPNDAAKNDSWTITSTSTDENTLSDLDEERMKELWKWSRKRLLFHPTMKASQGVTLDKLMQRDSREEFQDKDLEYGDLTVMVTAIIPATSDQATTGVSQRGYLRVWDGTGLPKSDPLPDISAIEAVETGDPPVEALSKIAQVIRQLCCIKRINMEPPKVVTGRVANVVIWEKTHWDLIQKTLSVGSFIRLRNVSENDMFEGCRRCLMVFSKTFLTPLPDLTFEVAHLLQNHNDRLLRKEPSNPHSGILPLDTDDSETQTVAFPLPLAQNMSQHSASASADVRMRLDSAAAFSPERAGSCQNIEKLIAGQPWMIFRGTVQIVGIIPTLNSLLVGGIHQIISSSENEQDRDSCKYEFAVRLKQPSSGHEIAAVVSHASTFGNQLMGMRPIEAKQDPSGALFNLQNSLEQSQRREWRVKISSIEFQDAKYFLLDSAEEVAR